MASTDYFAALGLPRRPWVDPEVAKARFLELAHDSHPDRVHQSGDSEKVRQAEAFARLNNSHQCLRETNTRLRHLIELETGVPPGDVKAVPAGSAGFVMKVARKCREADAFLEEKRQVASPILKTRLFAKAMAWTDELNALQTEGRQAEAALAERLRTLNAAWESAPGEGNPARLAALPMDELEELYRSASFLARSIQQVRSRIGQLAE